MTIQVMIVLLVFMALVGTLLILQQVKSLQRSKISNELDSTLKENLAQLEERVRTLERIATDRKSGLRDEIETL